MQPEVECLMYWLQVEHAVKGLTRTKESIKAATVLAAQAAQRGAAPRVIRYLIERIDKVQTELSSLSASAVASTV